MVHLADLPQVDEMSDAVLTVVEAFMGFCSEHSLQDPSHDDIAAFTKLHEISSEKLALLTSAFNEFHLDQLVADANKVASSLRHQENFDGIRPKYARAYERVVSLDESQLPRLWQATLSELRLTQSYAAAIIHRMADRLGVFARCARAMGEVPDLGSLAQQKAFFDDLYARSLAKNGQGARWAYVRSGFEEVLRFASQMSAANDVLTGLKSRYKIISEREAEQTPLKFLKVEQIAETPALLRQAEERLKLASTLKLPQMRHAARNKAAALAIGLAVPARPADVFAHHTFGTGIIYDEVSAGYRFRYSPQKTRNSVRDGLDILLAPHWNQFIDALILQDLDPSYLPELRNKVLDEKRALYVNYDGSRCALSWYSRAWAEQVGTGGHIARTLAYDSMMNLGEFGIFYASGICHHRSALIHRKYRSQNSVRKSYALAQNVMSLSASDDISDLLK